MTIDSESYQQQLLLALRVRNVSGPRIAEALAEVDSHLAESGEDPREAFGEPSAYAARIADALGSTEPMSLRTIFRSPPAGRVLDPRTGRDRTPPWPRWTAALWGLLPAAILLVAYLSGAFR